MNRTVQFTFNCIEDKQKILDYCSCKGFRKIGDFALFAMNSYMTRNPVRKPHTGAVRSCTGICTDSLETIKKLDLRISKLESKKE